MALCWGQSARAALRLPVPRTQPVRRRGWDAVLPTTATAADAGYGFGLGVAGLFTYTNYVGRINLEELTEPARELLDGFLGGQ